MHRVKRLLELVGEARELGSSTEAARRHLSDGLAHEAGAIVGAIVLDHGYRVNTPSRVKAATLVGFDSETLPAFAMHERHGTAFNPVHAAIMAQPANLDEVVTYKQDDLFAESDWNRTPWISEYATPCRLAHFVGSARWVGPGRVEGMGFMREVGERPFSDEERDVVHVVHAASSRLFEDGGPHLAPRVRQTFEALLTGAADKDIAQRLGLGLHTVRQYVKIVFRTYGVKSRSELLAKQIRRSPR
jgi:DNA-binding CsgD family transcriptional regulator